MVKKVSDKMNIAKTIVKRDLAGTGSDLDIETFAQKVAQEEDAGTRAINDKYGVPTKEDFDFKIFNDGTGTPTEIVKKEPTTSEMLMAGFKEEQAARKREEEIDEDANSKFLDDIANNTPNSGMFDHLDEEKETKFKKKYGYTLATPEEDEPKKEVINIDNYERYWDNSTPNGHQIRILKQDNSTLTINLEWPKGYNPRLREVKKR